MTQCLLTVPTEQALVVLAPMHCPAISIEPAFGVNGVFDH